MSELKPTLTFLGSAASPELVEIAAQYFSREKMTLLDNDIEKIVERPTSDSPAVIFVGSETGEAPISEFAQLLRMHYPETPIFYVITKRESLDRKLLIKNGFTDIFLLPLERVALDTRLKDEISLASKGKIKSFKPVWISDLEPGTQLNFDVSVYLSANSKYVTISTAGDALDEVKSKKLAQRNVKSLFVEKSQMQEFYKFSAKKLRDVNSDSNLSETEKRKKMSTAVRELMGGIFDDSSKGETIENGKAVMQNCQQIVSNFVLSGKDSSKSLYAKMQAAMGVLSESYSHPTNVSTFAAMFSMGTGIGNPEELALAGLLHDLGIADLPASIQQKNESEMTQDELKEFQKHPLHTIKIIKNRKMIVSEKVMKMITQHHEQYCGKGYPNGTVGERILPEAQLLAIADRLDEILTPKPGERQITILEAIEKMNALQAVASDQLMYDPKIFKLLMSLFQPAQAA